MNKDKDVAHINAKLVGYGKKVKKLLVQVSREKGVDITMTSLLKLLIDGGLNESNR